MSYREPMEVYAVIFGYLLRTSRKIQMTKVNKLADELGYDKVNSTQLKQYADMIDEDPELDSILTDAINGKITPDELKKYNTDNYPIKSEEEIHKVITPYAVEHQRVLSNNREFNKVQREGAYLKILMEDMKSDLMRHLPTLGKTVEKDEDFDLKLKGSTLVVTFSDPHIGAIVRNGIGWGYDFSVLQQRLQQYLGEIHKMVNTFNVDNIRLYMLGDIIENTNMRKQQSFETEFNMSEQISRGVTVTAKLLAELESLRPVKFFITNGNHSRLQSNKKEKIYNDSVEWVVLDQLFFLQEEMGLLQNTEIYDNRDAMNIFADSFQGKNIIGTHGDYVKGKKGNKITSLNINQPVNYLFTGHLHSVDMAQENNDSMTIQVGSIMGANTYSKENFFNESKPSQTLAVFSRDLAGPVIYPVFFN